MRKRREVIQGNTQQKKTTPEKYKRLDEERKKPIYHNTHALFKQFSNDVEKKGDKINPMVQMQFRQDVCVYEGMCVHMHTECYKEYVYIITQCTCK